MIITCGLCKNPIDTKKEKYVHVEDYDKEKKTNEIWCHYACFKKSMNRDLKELEKKARDMLDMAGGIFENLPEELKPKKEFVIA